MANLGRTRIEVDPAKPIRIFGYGRRSTLKQAATPAVQTAMIEDWVNENLARFPAGSEYTGTMIDESSSQIDMPDRPVGQMLFANLQPGDVIVVAKYNRAFRSAADAEKSFEKCAQYGAEMVFLDLAVDTTTPNGRLTMGIMAAVSRHERECIAERIKDAHAKNRELGYCVSWAPIGYKIKVNKRRKIYVPDMAQRKVALAIVKMYEDGFSTNDIFTELRKVYRREYRTKGVSRWKPRYGTTNISTMAGIASLRFPMVSQNRVVTAIGRSVSRELVRMTPAVIDSLVEKIKAAEPYAYETQHPVQGL